MSLTSSSIMSETSKNNESETTDCDRQVTNSKVRRVIEEYDLEGFGAELEGRWTGAYESRSSLRELADRFNRRVLEVAMERVGLSPLESEVQSKYEALTGDDVSSGVQIQARRDLERQGVDIDAVESDFVTHQAMHTYLTKYRGAELPSKSETDQLSKARDTMQRLRSRTVAVIENTLGR